MNALEDNELRWVKVVPAVECKAEWIGRFWLRGNNNGFIEVISSNWESFTDIRCDHVYEFMTGEVILPPTNYIEDSLPFILRCTGNYEGE